MGARHLPFVAPSVACLIFLISGPAAGQSAQQPQATKPATPQSGVTVATGGVVPPPGYVIGPEDVLSILFWREKNLSGDVLVRPDGRISLPLLNDIQAAGLTTDELREKVMAEANKFVEDPTATIVVKQINSRKVFITGNVSKPGLYALAGPLDVLQLIALAGGLLEYSDSSKIRVMRKENGAPAAHLFNYDEVAAGRNLKQNIELKPGDTVVVP
jgi:polysaccharide biosynthesis/export protein